MGEEAWADMYLSFVQITGYVPIITMVQKGWKTSCGFADRFYRDLIVAEIHYKIWIDLARWSSLTIVKSKWILISFLEDQDPINYAG